MGPCGKQEGFVAEGGGKALGAQNDRDDEAPFHGDEVRQVGDRAPRRVEGAREVQKRARRVVRHQEFDAGRPFVAVDHDAGDPSSPVLHAHCALVEACVAAVRAYPVDEEVDELGLAAFEACDPAEVHAPWRAREGPNCGRSTAWLAKRGRDVDDRSIVVVAWRIPAKRERA